MLSRPLVLDIDHWPYSSSMDANTESESKIKQQPDQQREQNIQKISEEDRALVCLGSQW